MQSFNGFDPKQRKVLRYARKAVVEIHRDVRSGKMSANCVTMDTSNVPDISRSILRSNRGVLRIILYCTKPFCTVDLVFQFGGYKKRDGSRTKDEIIEVEVWDGLDDCSVPK